MAVRQLAVSRFEICQVDEIALSPDRPLHHNQVREGADSCLDAIDAPNLRTGQEVREGQPGRSLGEKIEFTMRSRQMNRSIADDPVLGNGRSIRPGGAPPIDQSTNPLDVVRIGVEHGINVSRRSHDSVANQRDSANQHVANFRAIEVLEDSTEVRQRADASSAAWTLSAIPSASNSSGSREASLMRR